MKNYIWLFSFLTIGLTFISCKKKDPEIPNEQELITTLKYSLTPSSGEAPVVLSYKDIDGDGSGAPIVEGGTLAANETYTGKLELLNESVTPAESITAEIQEEDVDHQFFFESDVAGLSVAYNDEDANGNPVGLSSTLSTGEANAGTITIILRHKPEKSASGVPEGNIANAKGETDIQVMIPVDVQ